MATKAFILLASCSFVGARAAGHLASELGTCGHVKNVYSNTKCCGFPDKPVDKAVLCAEPKGMLAHTRKSAFMVSRVNDLAKAKSHYEAIGFTVIPFCTSDTAYCKSGMLEETFSTNSLHAIWPLHIENTENVAVPAGLKMHSIWMVNVNVVLQLVNFFDANGNMVNLGTFTLATDPGATHLCTGYSPDTNITQVTVDLLAIGNEVASATDNAILLGQVLADPGVPAPAEYGDIHANYYKTTFGAAEEFYYLASDARWTEINNYYSQNRSVAFKGKKGGGTKGAYMWQAAAFYTDKFDETIDFYVNVLGGVKLPTYTFMDLKVGLPQLQWMITGNNMRDIAKETGCCKVGETCNCAAELAAKGVPDVLTPGAQGLDLTHILFDDMAVEILEIFEEKTVTEGGVSVTYKKPMKTTSIAHGIWKVGTQAQVFEVAPEYESHTFPEILAKANEEMMKEASRRVNMIYMSYPVDHPLHGLEYTLFPGFTLEQIGIAKFSAALKAKYPLITTR